MMFPHAFWAGAPAGTPEVDDGLHRQPRVNKTSLYVPFNRQEFLTVYNDNIAQMTIKWTNFNIHFAELADLTIAAGASVSIAIFNVGPAGRTTWYVPLNGTYTVVGGGTGQTPTVQLKLPGN